MSGVIATSLIAFLSMFVPGVLLAMALLYKRTDFHLFEIVVIGFIFGLIAPASLTWIESFLIPYSPVFAFSLGLFEINALVLTIAGFLLCVQQGVFKGLSIGSIGMSRSAEIKAEQSQISVMEKDARKRLEEIRSKLSYFSSARELIARHKSEEDELRRRHNEEQRLVSKLESTDRAKLDELHTQEETKLIEQHEKEERILLNRLNAPKTDAKEGFNLRSSWPWIILIVLMLLAFGTRLFGIGLSPKFFEFDPYFDMMAAQSILVYGQQFYTSYSAWPVEMSGSVMRVQPLIPYLEAYWYSLANKFGPNNNETFNTNLMSYVGSVYPPITAALLVFSIFVLLYHEYGKFIGLIGAALTACMPVLFTTFVAGEQLLEPWGIFTLFFFFAAYIFAIRNPKSTRLAILAGIAFASTFLGAHYYTVDAGVLAAYIVLQGLVSVLRGTTTRDFYKMNITVILVIAVFLAAYTSYKSTLSGKIPGVLGLPITIALPILALLLIAVIEYGPKLLKRYNIFFHRLDWKEYIMWIVVVAILGTAVAFLSPLRASLIGYIAISAHYTTPSIPLFMTVQEYIPTGILYNFAGAGFGLLGAGVSFTNSSGTTTTIPVLVLIISTIALILIVISIIYRKSTVGILYFAIAFPLMFAGFSEVKYLPHFGIVLIMLFCIMIGEFLLIVDNNLSLKQYGRNLAGSDMKRPTYQNAFEKHTNLVYAILSMAIFFISPILAIIFLLSMILFKKTKGSNAYMYGLLFLFIIISFGAIVVNHSVMLGESGTIIQSFSAALTYTTNPSNACNIISAQGNSVGADIFCNLIPAYWLNAMAYINQNIGPYNARVLAWWDYGDWINWFGNSHAVLRGDNSAPLEDYATAASYVLGPASGYGPSTLANFMNTNQTEYVLFDQDLIGKWQAVDFLACVHVNETSRAFAIAAGQAESPAQPYALGTSQCEIQHDPEFVLVPLAALIPTNQTLQQSISFYCPASNSTAPLINSYLVQGEGLANETVCVKSVPNANGVLQIYNQSGGEMNAVIQSSFYEGVITISGIPFVEYLMLYLPNGPNDTITNAPTQFYSSNYYKGFILGDLPGFHEVYPSNSIGGINYVNGTYPIRIYALNNFTGQLPPVTPKPSWVRNNFTYPG